jgi:hypothetical protein
VTDGRIVAPDGTPRPRDHETDNLTRRLAMFEVETPRRRLKDLIVPADTLVYEQVPRVGLPRWWQQGRRPTRRQVLSRHRPCEVRVLARCGAIASPADCHGWL